MQTKPIDILQYMLSSYFMLLNCMHTPMRSPHIMLYSYHTNWVSSHLWQRQLFCRPHCLRRRPLGIASNVSKYLALKTLQILNQLAARPHFQNSSNPESCDFATKLCKCCDFCDYFGGISASSLFFEDSSTPSSLRPFGPPFGHSDLLDFVRSGRLTHATFH